MKASEELTNKLTKLIRVHADLGEIIDGMTNELLHLKLDEENAKKFARSG